MTKTPNWATRMQRAVSGRTLRTSDYVNPVWTFKLIYAVLHDKPWCSFTSPTELRTMMDFFNSSGGAFDGFLLDDPSDDSVTGQVLPPAMSFAAAAANVSIVHPGTGYTINDILYLNIGGGSATVPLTLQVAALGAGNGIAAPLTLLNGGAYFVVPGTTNLALDGGTGSGATVNVTWTTQVQLVRTLVSGGFQENIIAPNVVGNIYFNGVPQLGWTVDATTGLVTLPTAFLLAQPLITADFTYYFRVYFPDALDFEEFAYQYWQVKQVKLTSVVL